MKMRARSKMALLAALCLAGLSAVAQLPGGVGGATQKAAGLSRNPLPELLSLGRVLAYRGSLAESRLKFSEAARLCPTNAEAYQELGLNLMMSGQTNAAAGYFSQALHLEPGLAEQNKRTAKALMNGGQLGPARRRLILACCLKPEDVDARLTLAFCPKPEGTQARENGGAFRQYLDRLDEAFYQFEKTFRFRPAAEAYDHLGATFAAHGMLVEAMQEYREAVRIHPDDAGALNQLAWNLATCPKPGLRNGREAVQLATRAVELTNGQRPDFIGTLAAAYAETGQFSKAVETAQKARALALSMGQAEEAARNEQWSRLYSAGKTVNTAPGP